MENLLELEFITIVKDLRLVVQRKLQNIIENNLEYVIKTVKIRLINFNHFEVFFSNIFLLYFLNNFVDLHI